MFLFEENIYVNLDLLIFITSTNQVDLKTLLLTHIFTGVAM